MKKTLAVAAVFTFGLAEPSSVVDAGISKSVTQRDALAHIIAAVRDGNNWENPISIIDEVVETNKIYCDIADDGIHKICSMNEYQIHYITSPHMADITFVHNDKVVAEYILNASSEEENFSHKDIFEIKGWFLRAFASVIGG